MVPTYQVGNGRGHRRHRFPHRGQSLPIPHLICRKFKSGFRDAPREISIIVEDVSSVGHIAQRLLKLVEEDDKASLALLQTVSRRGGTLEMGLTELYVLKKSVKVDHHSRLKTALKWPLMRSKTLRQVQAIGSIKSTLQLALNADIA